VTAEGRDLRVGVVGVGHLGRHHARILSSLPGVKLAMVADINAVRAREVAERVGADWCDDAAGLIGRVDGVTIAVPTESHAAVALPFLSRGIPALVEKPLARSVSEADRMIDAAARAGVPLAVGHTERFNPAVSAVLPHLTGPRFIEVHRLGTFPERSLDIDVVFDLMIHDLDVVLALVGGEVISLEAVGVPVLTPRIDIANARLRFDTGCIANITASRISREKVRKLRFFQHDSYISVDYAQQEVEHWRLDRAGAGPLPRIAGGRLDVVRDEPLRLEMVDFIEAARTGRMPAVPGEAGRRALALAERITVAIGTDTAAARPSSGA
jgi:predicted dehydrogenase